MDERSAASGEGVEVIERLLGLLTPVAKSWPSEFCLEGNSLAIQIHGGYGYTREFDVEQVYRDNRMNPIHEGTTGIQALDLLGRKILRDGGRSLAELTRLIARTVEAASSREILAADASQLQGFWSEIDETIARLREDLAADAVEDSWAFLPAFGHGIVGWILLDQAVLVQSGNRPHIEPVLRHREALGPALLLRRRDAPRSRADRLCRLAGGPAVARGAN